MGADHQPRHVIRNAVRNAAQIPHRIQTYLQAGGFHPRAQQFVYANHGRRKKSARDVPGLFRAPRQNVAFSNHIQSAHHDPRYVLYPYGETSSGT